MLEEKPFLFGVTMWIPAERNCGYAEATDSSEVLSTRMTGPGAEVRNFSVSVGKAGGAVVLEERADVQSESENPV